MKDYERYMNRQRMSETGMARLMKLETERPEKGTRAGKKRQALPRWARTLGMAASLVLVVGLCALPVLRWAAQRANPQPTEEELFFHEVDSVPFTDHGIVGGMKLVAMEPEDAAEIFGCAPDDFVGLLETVGLDKFNMEYYAVDMARQGDDSYRFLMKGNYISPREKPENWDETSEISWEMYLATSSFYPGNNVWLEIYEGHSYLAEKDWAALEPQTFQGHQVTAACGDEKGYYAAAAFDVECNGKTYGVLYSAVTYGDCNAKELVTQMVRYLTANGLTIPGNELVFNEVEGVPQNGNAPEGLHDTTMDVYDMGMILHSSGEWWDDICAEFGWTGYDVSGTSTPAGRDPETNYALTYFRISGQHRTGEQQWDGSSFELALMPNMTDFAAYTAQDIHNWDALEVSTVNGIPVTAAIYYHPSQQVYYAAATFVVEDSICDYGVFYQVCVKTETEAKDLVTRAVNYLTSGGVFTEMYGAYGFGVMDYDELTQVSTQRPGMTVGDSRPLSREEIEWVFPPLAEGGEEAWYGTAYFYPDGSLGSIVLSGFTNYGGLSDETAVRQVTIVMGKEEETFRDNYVDGGYIGAETEGYRDNRLRGYWRHDPEYVWGSDADDLGADVFVCQMDPNLGWVAEITTAQKDGTFDENRWLNTDWVVKAMGNLWWKDDLTMETDGIFVREYDTLDELRAAVDERFLPYLPTTLMDHDEFHGYWRRNSGEYESAEARWDKPWVIQDNYARFSYSGDVDVMWPITAMGLPEVTDINDRESYDFREHPGLDMPELGRGGFQEEIYEKLYLPTFRAKDASLDLIQSRIYQDPEGQVDGYPEATAECMFQLLHDNNVLVRYQFHGMTAEEIWTVVQETIPGRGRSTAVEPSGVFYLESAKGETLVYPYLNLSGNGNTFSWWRGEESSRSGSYAVTNGKVRCHRSGKTYVFETVDESTLRYVGAESDALDYLDTGRVTRTLPDGAVLRCSDAQLATLDAALNAKKSDLVWDMAHPDGGDTTELSGTYYLESADGGVIGNMAKIAFDGDTATISSDRLHFHTCVCSSRTRERVDGKELVRMICDKCDGVFSFEIVDEDTLRLDMDNSSLHGDHHSDWTFEVSDGTVFRHPREGEDADALPVAFGAPQSQSSEWKQGGITVIQIGNS